MTVLASITIITVIICKLTPFPIWSNVSKLIKYILLGRNINFTLKIHLLLYIVQSVLLLFIKSIFWQLDKLILTKVVIRDPVIIIGNPRSGTTFLHRILAEHKQFHTLTYFQMKFPSVIIWKCIDAMGIANHIGKVNYWPNNDAGKLASKLHKHTYGDKEEIGMFLEEIMMSHFFLYRRFPFTRVALDIADLNNLDRNKWNRLLNGIQGLFARSLFYHQAQEKIVLIKENESATFLRKLLDIYPKAKFIFIYRPAEEVSASYQTLSIISTQAKTGINPKNIDNWQETNDNFRLREMQDSLKLFKDLPNEQKLLVSYDNFTKNIYEEIKIILNWLGMDISDEYFNYLQLEMTNQSIRNKGYDNQNHNLGNTSEYDNFFQELLELN